jgi:DNA-binding NarL/FixJ family response regulator
MSPWWTSGCRRLFTHEGAEVAAKLREQWPELGIVLLSQTIEVRHAAELARAHPRGFGYLLKDRVLDVATLVDVLVRVAHGGTVLDPDVVGALLGRHQAQDHLSRLSVREREVLGLVAEGRSNAAIATHLVLTEKTVETHIANIMMKLDLMQTPDDHRRVLAVPCVARGMTPRRCTRPRGTPKRAGAKTLDRPIRKTESNSWR